MLITFGYIFLIFNVVIYFIIFAIGSSLYRVVIFSGVLRDIIELLCCPPVCYFWNLWSNECCLLKMFFFLYFFTHYMLTAITPDVEDWDYKEKRKAQLSLSKTTY